MNQNSKINVSIAVCLGAVVGGALFWADSQLGEKVGRLEIGIAFRPPNLNGQSDAVPDTTMIVLNPPSEIANTPVSPIESSSTTTATTTTTTLALPPDVDASWREEVLFLTNTERLKEGLEPLLHCGNLHRAAQTHAKAMKDQNFFEHDNPFTGDDPSDRAIQAGYQSGAGENIAMGYQSPKEVVRGWMNSPGHRENILSSYRDIGIGIFRGGSDRYGDGDWFYWVQNFGQGGNCG